MESHTEFVGAPKPEEITPNPLRQIVDRFKKLTSRRPNAELYKIRDGLFRDCMHILEARTKIAVELTHEGKKSIQNAADNIRDSIALAEDLKTPLSAEKLALDYRSYYDTRTTPYDSMTDDQVDTLIKSNQQRLQNQLAEYRRIEHSKEGAHELDRKLIRIGLPEFRADITILKAEQIRRHLLNPDYPLNKKAVALQPTTSSLSQPSTPH